MDVIKRHRLHVEASQKRDKRAREAIDLLAEGKEKAGLLGARRGKEAAALDAVGAALGSFGLAAFGLVSWLMIVQSLGWALGLAAASWLAVALLAWQVRRWL